MMIRRRARSVLALTATALAAALTLTACGSGGAGSADGRLDVVASFYPMEFLASQIGGEHVKVTGLTAAGVEPHDLELTAKQVGRVQKADAVVYLKGLQPTVDKAVADSRAKQKIDATAAAPLEDHHLAEGHTEDDGHDHADEHGDGHHHDEAAGDPHIWLDPTRYAAVARSVGAGFSEADPAHADDYRRNTDELVGRLTALDQEFKDGLKDATTRTFVTSHAAFGYLAEAYGLTQVSINGVDPESEPTPARLADVQKAAKENGVTTIFFETLASPRLAETVAKDLGLKTAVLDPLEGVKDRTKDDYLSVMRQNLTNLRAALGATAPTS
ncbi:metal ABC transporter substrate-binding protein [Kitasatospora sp. NPDC001527]|uniref:metal ABC transporter substrate-binding protein n=1 Tax=Kitasatospora sp. NPDC001527 TaxID=3154519 RepID=UPI00331A1D57